VPNTDLSVLVLVALREELGALLCRMRRKDVEHFDGLVAYRGTLGATAVAVIRTGMGPERSRHAAETGLARFRPRLVVIAGFCASLRSQIRPGTVVCATALHDGKSVRLPRLPAPPGAFCGDILSAAAVATRAADKAKMAALHPSCVAMDMESAAAAAVADAAGVPWICLRAVTDGLDDDLPLAFAQHTARDGDVSRAGIALAVAVRPWKLPALVRLGVRSALAARNLADAAERTLVRPIASRAGAG